VASNKYGLIRRSAEHMLEALTPIGYNRWGGQKTQKVYISTKHFIYLVKEK